MLTEQEAREKWCPFARLAIGMEKRGEPNGVCIVPDYPSHNRTQISGLLETHWSGGCCCIASDCMAWRGVPDAGTYEPGKAPGYCGLAGKPDA